jgi:integrase
MALSANSFEVVAREWYERNMSDKSDSHKNRTLANLERDVYPWLGKKPITDIKAPDLLAMIRKVEDRGAVETARRILQVCGQILRYGIATGRLESDVSPALRGSLKPPVTGHFGAITDPKALGALLRAIDEYSGSLW